MSHIILLKADFENIKEALEAANILEEAIAKILHKESKPEEEKPKPKIHIETTWVCCVCNTPCTVHITYSPDGWNPKENIPCVCNFKIRKPEWVQQS